MYYTQENILYNSEDTTLRVSNKDISILADIEESKILKIDNLQEIKTYYESLFSSMNIFNNNNLKKLAKDIVLVTFNTDTEKICKELNTLEKSSKKDFKDRVLKLKMGS
jgi:hypothetical protein